MRELCTVAGVVPARLVHIRPPDSTPARSQGYYTAGGRAGSGLTPTDGRMKDCDGPSTYDDDDCCQRRCVDGHCPSSNGEIRLSNGAASGCLRRPSGGGRGWCDVNGSYCHVLASNGRPTAPRVDQPPAAAAALPPTAAEHGLAAGVELVGGGWTVPTRIQILQDVANLCTFTGAILATLAMACMWKGRYGTDAHLSLIHI